MLTRLGDGELCDLVGICTETNVKVQASYSVEAVSGVNGASVECEFCEKVIQHWVDVWTANTTENEFKEVLEALCHKLGSGDRVDSCLKVVDEYYLPWFNYLLHNINPEVICNAIGLCGPGEFMKVRSVLNESTQVLDMSFRRWTNDSRCGYCYLQKT